MAEQTDCVVIGGGVVGLACAREMALAGHEVVIIEAENAIGMHTSARNTSCIHAGINYVPGSLKARLVLRGKELLYRFCPEHGVAHKRCGKLMVAVDDAGAAELPKIKANAEVNGLHDMEFLDPAQVKEMEPELAFHTVLYSPSSGIIDTHELMLALLGDAEDHGAVLALSSPVSGGRVTGDDIEVDVGGKEAVTLKCRVCINAAGFGAQKIASSMDGLPPETVPGQVLQKGVYFVAASKRPFTHLIYPLPGEHATSVHVSPDVSGAVRFGPNTVPTDKLEYSVDESLAPFFYEAARRFWPGIEDGDLVPGWAGVRPKTSNERASRNDFIIQDESVHGVSGLINLYGIESPGMTSSMAIAEHVRSLLPAA
ncbi:MAG TPA: NAD(P)/FAD-dependent oxidoreductase [Alphaproteobacteria bacterium]|nr:NAD(P)/FAD-dependent oxidoreductase [Alphaproteobacteria bacterium]